MTPEQEAAANVAANKIISELTAAQTPQECEEISRRTEKLFKRLQQVHPVRAIHIVNLAKVKKRQFEKMDDSLIDGFDI